MVPSLKQIGVVGGIFFLMYGSVFAQSDPVQSGTNDALCVSTAIQSAVEKDITLSAHAHHIKVVTTDAHEIYLQGTVISEAERARIKDIAAGFSGDYLLKDQLVVGQ